MTQLVKNLPTMRETPVQSLGQEDPVEKEMTTHPVVLPGEFHGQRRLVATVHEVTKSRTLEKESEI